jgi:hypothetical protein
MNVIIILTDKNKRQVNLWIDVLDVVVRWQLLYDGPNSPLERWTASLWHENAAVGHRGLVGFTGSGTWQMPVGLKSVFFSSYSEVCILLTSISIPGVKKNDKGSGILTSKANCYLAQGVCDWECFDVQY